MLFREFQQRLLLCIFLVISNSLPACSADVITVNEHELARDVTVTSFIGYPVTTTVYINQGQSTPTTTAANAGGYAATVTVTRYTTVSSGQTYVYQTLTSNGYVIVVANPTGTVNQANVSSGNVASSSLLKVYGMGTLALLILSMF